MIMVFQQWNGRTTKALLFELVTDVTWFRHQRYQLLRVSP